MIFECSFLQCQPSFFAISVDAEYISGGTLADRIMDKVCASLSCFDVHVARLVLMMLL